MATTPGPSSPSVPAEAPLVLQTTDADVAELPDEVQQSTRFALAQTVEDERPYPLLTSDF